MSFNQQLREPRVLAILNPRVIALMAVYRCRAGRCRLQIRTSAGDTAYLDTASGGRRGA